MDCGTRDVLTWQLDPVSLWTQNFCILWGPQSFTLKAFNWVDEAHPHYRVIRFTQSLPIQMKVSQFSCSVVSDSLRPHGLQQHARFPCPSATQVTCSNSCPLSQWCHPAISSSVIPFSSCPQSFPASGSFQKSQLFASSTRHKYRSFSVSPSNEHPRLISFRTDWLGLLAVQGTLKSLLQHHSSKASIL